MATGERQKPIELILARNFISSISTPSFLVDESASLVFYNDAAGALLGRRFEETGRLGPQEWTQRWGPFDADGCPLVQDELPLTQALRHGRPSHGCFTIRDASGDMREIVSSALPIVGTGSFRGAIIFFWPAEDPQASRERTA